MLECMFSSVRVKVECVCALKSELTKSRVCAFASVRVNGECVLECAFS